MASWFTAASGAVATLSGATSTGGSSLRFPQQVALKRPTIDRHGDVTLPAGTSGVRAGIYPRRRKAVLGGTGEVFEVTAVGFFPAGTDVQRRDRVVLASGEVGGPHTFEVVTVVPAFTDLARTDHVAVELRDAAEE